MPDLDDLQRVVVDPVPHLHTGEICVLAVRTAFVSVSVHRPSRSAAARPTSDTTPCRARLTGTALRVSIVVIVRSSVGIALATARSALPIIISRRRSSVRAVHIISARNILVVLVADLEDILLSPAVLLDSSPPAPHALHARARPEIATSETRVVLPQPGIAAQAPLTDGLEAAWGVVCRWVVR